jgi:hypothetical protein
MLWFYNKGESRIWFIVRGCGLILLSSTIWFAVLLVASIFSVAGLLAVVAEKLWLAIRLCLKCQVELILTFHLGVMVEKVLDQVFDGRKLIIRRCGVIKGDVT